MSTSKKSDGYFLVIAVLLVIAVVCIVYYVNRESCGRDTYIIEGLGGGRGGGSGSGTRWLGSGSALSRSTGGLGGGGDRRDRHRPWYGGGRRFWGRNYPSFYNYYSFPYDYSVPYYYRNATDECVNASYNEKDRCEFRGGVDCDVKLARMLNECD